MVGLCESDTRNKDQTSSVDPLHLRVALFVASGAASTKESSDSKLDESVAQENGNSGVVHVVGARGNGKSRAAASNETGNCIRREEEESADNLDVALLGCNSPRRRPAVWLPPRVVDIGAPPSMRA